MSAYIPTNVISITDGQIYLQPDLFYKGVRPAINAGISVSRVGSAAQIPAMKQVAGGLRLQLAAYRELEAFAQLGTDLDAATQARLDRGARMVEILKQPQNAPMNVIDQVLVIFAATNGYLDDVPITSVRGWETAFLETMHTSNQDLWDKINASQSLDKKKNPELVEQVIKIIGDFKQHRQPGLIKQAATVR